MSNNNNNKNNNNFEKRNWKMYVSLALYAILGLALGYALTKGGLYLKDRMQNSKMKVEEISEMKESKSSTFATSLTHNFEGGNKAEASFDHKDDFAVVPSLKTKNLYTVNNAAGEKVATVYFYFNGGRGATPEEYITETIKKSVPSISVPANVTHGLSVWSRAESGATEWHLKLATNNAWLMYVESATVNNAEVANILKSVDVK